jgi:ABC-type spermidine/putrescine transport system permease subunit II
MKCGCAARVHVSAVDMQARVRGAAGRSSYVALLRCCSSLVCGLAIGLVIARGAAGRSSWVSHVALVQSNH